MTEIAERIAKFWHDLETPSAYLKMYTRQVSGMDLPDGPVLDWESTLFSEEVAKALVAERKAMLRALGRAER